MTIEKLTVLQALYRAQQIDRNLSALERTAPQTVAGLGGRDGLSRHCEMTCIGPVLRVDHATWERMSREYEEHREHSSTNRGQ